MKTGLVSFHFSDNYGALYQAYGLRQWFVDRGHDAQFINYHPAYVEEGGALDRPWEPSLWRKNATIAYMWISHTWRRLFGDKKQAAGFDAFRRDYLGISGERIDTAEGMAKISREYELLVCGSDQIWNPSIQRGVDPVYFLDFPGSAGARKIAYAPSFGREEIEAHHLPQVGALVSKLDGISVRESSGADILEGAGVERERVHVVPDPTILFGDFRKLMRQHREADSAVFCYALRTDEVIRNVAEQAAQKLGVPLVSSRNSRQRWRDIGTGISPGPVEWLQRLVNAEFVVSNSFHGVALSIIHSKPFIAVKLPGKRAGLNARVENLLHLTNLEHRALENADSQKVGKILETPIDWDATNARLSELRATGSGYLEAKLADIGQMDKNSRATK